MILHQILIPSLAALPSSSRARTAAPRPSTTSCPYAAPRLSSEGCTRCSFSQFWVRLRDLANSDSALALSQTKVLEEGISHHVTPLWCAAVSGRLAVVKVHLMPCSYLGFVKNLCPNFAKFTQPHGAKIYVQTSRNGLFHFGRFCCGTAPTSMPSPTLARRRSGPPVTSCATG